MRPETNVLYLGTDSEFFLELKIYCQLFMKKEIPHSQSYSSGLLAQLCSHTAVNLVFVDFTELDDNFASALEEINFIKRIPKFKSIVFIGLFKDSDHLREFPHLFVCGIHLSFLKGCETEILFKDAFYMGFGLQGPGTQFAKAINIFKPHELFICSSASQMDASSFLVESDIESEETLDCALTNLFPEVNERKLPIISKHSTYYISPMTVSYQVNYPFPDPFNDDLEGCLLPETLETWFAINQESLDSKKGFIQVFSDDVGLVEELYHVHQSSPFQVEFLKHIDTEDLVQRLELKRPEIIFYDNMHGPEEATGLAQIINSLSRVVEYHPVIVVSHSTSTSIALQKAYNYQFILAITGSLAGLFGKLIDSFVEIKGLKQRQPLSTFKASDKRRALDIKQMVTVVSLTEHELIFFTDCEIPMFAVLHLVQPLDCYLTLLPPPFNLPVAPNKFYYYGVIHGLSEEKIMLLRQFVNQLIAQPSLELRVNLEDGPLVDEAAAERVVPETKVCELAIPSQVQPPVSMDSTKRSNAFNLKGKTKL